MSDKTENDPPVRWSAWLGGWQSLDTAPLDGTYILLAGPSGYIGTPLRAEVCKYDAEYRPHQPWVNHSNDSFMDGGEAPTCWMPLPPPNDTLTDGAGTSV